MLKAESLTATLAQHSQWCQAHPDGFFACVEDGVIETPTDTLFFIYRYKLKLCLLNFTADFDQIVLPLLAWLWHHQPDVLLDQPSGPALAFTSFLDDSQRLQVEITIPLRERTGLTLNNNGQVQAEPLPELCPQLPTIQETWRALLAREKWGIV